MEEPKPRDVIDHLREVTALAESLRAAIGAIAVAIPHRQAVLEEYDEATKVLAALAQGEPHSERYLELLEQQIAKTRLFLAPPTP